MTPSHDGASFFKPSNRVSRRPDRAPRAEPDDDYSSDVLDGIDRLEPVTTDGDVLERVARLVQTAYRDQWWFFLLDDRGVQLPVIPQIEMPRRFGEEEAEHVAATIAQTHEVAAEIVLVWELRTTHVTEAAVGPSLLAAALTRLGGTLRAQVVVLPEHRVSLWEPDTARDVA